MKKIIALGTILLTPALAFAAPGDLGQLNNLVSGLGNIVEKLIPIVFGIAVLVFFWGLAKYILAAGSEEAKAEGRRIMIGGIIALFIMSSIWGITKYLGAAIGIDKESSVTVPGIQKGNSNLAN